MSHSAGVDWNVGEEQPRPRHSEANDTDFGSDNLSFSSSDP